MTPSNESEQTAPLATRGVAESPEMIRMLSVLIIDWDATAREVVSSAAGRRGFYATTCTTAEEAQNLCMHTRFDVIIVDADLYGMPVLEFIEWLQRHPDSLHSSHSPGEEAKILVSAGGLAQEQFKRLFAAGVDDFLPKPVQVEAAEWRLAILEQKIKKSSLDAAEEKRVAKNRLRFENIFLEAPDAILVLKNREGKIIGANRAVKELLGYDGKSLLGKYLSLIFPELFQGEGLSAFGSFLKEACTR
ncbi:MAG: response regulator, partial [Verrucomicrobiales bacterium]